MKCMGGRIERKNGWMGRWGKQVDGMNGGQIDWVDG